MNIKYSLYYVNFKMKIANKIICALLLTFLILSCVNKENEVSQTIYPKTLHINLNEAISDSMELSDIAEKVEYVPLQTADSILLGYFWDFVVTDDNFFIKNDLDIFRFDNKGNFLNKLYNVGKGPGESSARCFAVDETLELVYVFDQLYNDVKIYTFNGVYIKTIKAPILPSGSWLFSMGLFNNYLFVPIPQGPNINYLYSLFNIKNDSIHILYKNFRNYNKSQLKKFHYKTYDYHYQISDSSILFKERFSDTIFSVNKSLVQNPRYIIDLGSYKLDWEEWRDNGMFNTSGKAPYGYQVQSFIESKNFLFLVLRSFQESEILVVYNKNKDSIKIYKNSNFQKPSDQVYLKNNLDELITFPLMNKNAYLFYHENCLYTVIESTDFVKDYKYASQDKKGTTKYLREKISLFNSVNEFSNPIIIRVYLK